MWPRIVVAVRKNEIVRTEAQVAEYKLAAKVRVVEGGDNRQHLRGQRPRRSLTPPATMSCWFTGAVRPLIEPATIERTIDAVIKHGAAIVGLPAVDTIKQVERTADGAIIHLHHPRERIVQAQTPQGFRFGLMQKALAEAEVRRLPRRSRRSRAFFERAGIEVAVVMGSPRNFKITQPGDLELAEFYLKQ